MDDENDAEIVFQVADTVDLLNALLERGHARKIEFRLHVVSGSSGAAKLMLDSASRATHFSTVR
jgi:hypothetical protein